MKNFNFVARDEKGQQQQGQIQAAHRSRVLETLQQRGWVPLSVSEAPNAGINTQQVGQWALLVSVILILAIGALYWLTRPQKSVTKKSRAAVATVTGAKKIASTNAISVKEIKQAITPQQPQPVVGIPSNVISRTPLADLRYGTNRVKSGRPLSRGDGYSSMTERYINMVINTKLGMKPLPLFKLPKGEDIGKMLQTAIIVYDADTEKQIEQKANVAKAKEILKDYLSQGGTTDQFLGFYHGVLEEAAAERSTVQQQMLDLVKKGDREAAYLFMEEANKTLGAKGYMLLKPTPNMRQK